MTKEENPQNQERDFPLSWKAQTPRFPHSHRTATAAVLASTPHQSKSKLQPRFRYSLPSQVTHGFLGGGETIDRYVPNVLRSSSHFRLAKSAHPLIRSDDARRTGVLVEVGRVGRSWSNAYNSFVPRFSRAPDMGLTVAQIFAQKQAYAAQ
jgi:hypothetical protein